MRYTSFVLPSVTVVYSSTAAVSQTAYDCSFLTVVPMKHVYSYMFELSCSYLPHVPTVVLCWYVVIGSALLAGPLFVGRQHTYFEVQGYYASQGLMVLV